GPETANALALDLLRRNRVGGALLAGMQTIADAAVHVLRLDQGSGGEPLQDVGEMQHRDRRVELRIQSAAMDVGAGALVWLDGRQPVHSVGIAVPVRYDFLLGRGQQRAAGAQRRSRHDSEPAARKSKHLHAHAKRSPWADLANSRGGETDASDTHQSKRMWPVSERAPAAAD